MPLIIPTGFAQAVYIHGLDGDSENMVNTCGHDISGAVGTGTDIANDLFDHWAEQFVDIMSNETGLIGVDLYVGNGSGPPTLFQSTRDLYPGGGTGEMLPQNCAILMKKRTGLAGRRGRGRMYLPSMAIEGQVSQTGGINTSYLAGLQTRATAWVTGLNGPSPTAPPVILHRSEGAGTEPAPTPVTALQVDGTIATQRRRLRP